MNTIALLLLGLAFWGIEMPTGPGRWIGLFMIVAAVALVAAHLLASTGFAMRHAGRLLGIRWLEWLRNRAADKAMQIGRTMADSYRLFGDLVWPVALLAVARHLLGITSFGLMARSLDVPLSFLAIGWIRVVLQAVLMLPISFSGIGLRDGSLVILLQQYDVAASKAVALSFLLFASVLLYNSLGGVMELCNVTRAGRGKIARQSNPP